MNMRLPLRARARRRAGGFTLIVTLILLVLITLAAIASMRSVALQSRMSATAYDRQIAYQAAEAALRDGETRALAATSASFPASGCTNGFCADAAPGDAARWASDTFTGWQDSSVTVSNNAVTPQAIVERYTGESTPGCSQASPIDPNCLIPMFRVTSRSTAAGRASVTLQSDLTP